MDKMAELINKKNSLIEELEIIDKKIAKMKEDRETYYHIAKQNKEMLEKMKQYMELKEEMNNFYDSLYERNVMCEMKCHGMSYEDAVRNHVCPLAIVCGFIEDPDDFYYEKLNDLLIEIGD